MTEQVIYSTENHRYAHYEKQSFSSVNRRCIDGSFTGCGNCVGYCQFREHPGFLTREMRKAHDCLNKKCHYYLPKPQRPKVYPKEDISSALLKFAQQIAIDIDDLRIMNTHRIDGAWVIEYITVFGQHDLVDIEQALKEKTGVTVVMKKINYSFDRCVELMCSRC